MSGVSVLYLERAGNPPELMDNFVKSIINHPSGIGFNYVNIRKGFNDNIGFPIADVGGALNTLVKVLRLLTCDKFLFLTSYSEVLADNWLKHYVDAFKQNNVGIVGATGSYERNKHIRTNAFMMDRCTFLELAGTPFESRADECEFEAGENNLTLQLMKRGLDPLVIDRSGKHWASNDWQESGTFRSGNQENLLISDNRTKDYLVANDQNKTHLRELAWGTR
jgi:hypothetical protein